MLVQILKIIFVLFSLLISHQRFPRAKWIPEILPYHFDFEGRVWALIPTGIGRTLDVVRFKTVLLHIILALRFLLVLAAVLIIVWVSTLYCLFDRGHLHLISLLLLLRIKTQLDECRGVVLALLLFMGDSLVLLRVIVEFVLSAWALQKDLLFCIF